MQLPVFATRVSIAEGAPTSGGGIADTPDQDHAALFQSVFSKTPLGNRGAARDGDAPQKLVAQAMKTNNSGRAGVVQPAPALASAMRPATGMVVAIIEPAAMITVSSAAEVPSPRPVSKAGFHVDPGAPEEGSADEDRATNGLTAVDAVAPQPSAQAEARPEGGASAIGSSDVIVAPGVAAISDTAESLADTSPSLAPVPIESSARGLSAKGNSAWSGASEGWPTAPSLASPLGHVEQNARVGVNEQAPAMAGDILPASRQAWNAPAGPDRSGARITDRAKPAPALPDVLLRRDEDPGQQSATPGGERGSGPAAEGRSETRWGEPPPAPAQRPERHAPVVPAIGREGAMAGAFAVGAERDAVSGGDQDADIADRFAADLPLSDTRSTVIHTQVSTTAGPELARGVVVQLAAIISTARERSVELKLHPEELGRVSMTLLQDGGALTVALTAERGETLELMRRHIDLLGDELRRLGYASVDFTFGDGQAGGGQSHTAASPRGATVDADGLVTTPDVATETATNPARAAAAIEADGMDIRL